MSDSASTVRGSAGYRRGEEARARILDAALAAFGDSGFRGATTRRIADDAGVALPALTYYFGGKEGLYLACAEAIAQRFRDRMLQPILEVVDGLEADAGPEAARASLKRIAGLLADLLVGAPEAQAWTAFILREMSEPGPAFEVLFQSVWAPGVALTTTLVARTRGEPADSESARIEALMLISSLQAFSTARPVALRILGWPDAEAERLAAVRRALDARIDAL